MTLIIEKPTTSKLILAKDYVGIDDPDAAVYVAAVEAADEAASPNVGALETATKVAIHSFVKGCKNDGIWPAIKACCILAGARTTSGALVPLVGTAPTPFNFDLINNTDYDRKTGLVGDATAKQINTGNLVSSLSITNHHMSVYATSVNGNTGTQAYIGEVSTNTVLIYRAGSSPIFRSATTNSANSGLSGTATGLIALSRNQSANYTEYVDGSTNQRTQTATVITSGSNIFVFSRGNSLYGSGRIAFYSFGESLNLTQLDTRVSALITAIGAAF